MAAGRVAGCRLLHQSRHVHAIRGRRDYAVTFQVGRIVHGRQHRAAAALVGGDELAGQRRLPEHQVVGIGHHERVVAGEVAGQQQRVTGAEHPLLAHEGDRALRRGQPRPGGRAAAARQCLLQLQVAVEVVFQHALAAGGDYQQVTDPGVHQLADDEVERRPVQQRQHLLRHGAGGRQKPRAVAGGQNNSLHPYRCTANRCRTETRRPRELTVCRARASMRRRCTDITRWPASSGQAPPSGQAPRPHPAQ